MKHACDDCLRRAHLLGLLAPGIADRITRRERAVPCLLALPDDELIAAAAPRQAELAYKYIDRFDPVEARDRVASAGLAALCRHSTAYPELLARIADPPTVLFTTSTVERFAELSNEPAVAIVGGRRCSGYAREVAHELGRGLGVTGVTVVSGLALGIDAEAHAGTVAGNGGAIAVLAGGADVPYPRRNRALYERIREHGAVISELPPGIRPFKWGFPARNRIMAGIAPITVIVEAAEGSGSLITADFATQFGREVCAVPGWVTSRLAAGSNRLLHEGATIVRGPEDVLELLFGVGSVPQPTSVAEKLEPELRSVLDAVEGGDGLEAMSEAAQLSPADVRSALGRLELLGLIVREGVGSYRRTAVR